MAANSLRRVQQAADKASRARDEFHQSIREARSEGESIRAIARAAGLSPSRVFQIIQTTGNAKRRGRLQGS